MDPITKVIIQNLMIIAPVLLIIFAFSCWLLKYIIREAIKEAFEEMGITKKE